MAGFVAETEEVFSLVDFAGVEDDVAAVFAVGFPVEAFFVFAERGAGVVGDIDAEAFFIDTDLEGGGGEADVEVVLDEADGVGVGEVFGEGGVGEAVVHVAVGSEVEFDDVGAERGDGELDEVFAADVEGVVVVLNGGDFAGEVFVREFGAAGLHVVLFFEGRFVSWGAGIVGVHLITTWVAASGPLSSQVWDTFSVRKW